MRGPNLVPVAMAPDACWRPHGVPMQSLLLRHLFPAVHGGHDGPPQSTSVSAPFLMPSLHVCKFYRGAASVSWYVGVGSAPPHVGGLLPHILPSRSPAPRVIAKNKRASQTWEVALQTPPWQSLSTRQDLPAGQPEHPPPPQSTSVSWPFLTPSLHDCNG